MRHLVRRSVGNELDTATPKRIPEVCALPERSAARKRAAQAAPGPDERKSVAGQSRLGWSLRRIEKATGIRCDTAGGYLRSAEIGMRSLASWGETSLSKPATLVTTGYLPKVMPAPWALDIVFSRSGLPCSGTRGFGNSPEQAVKRLSLAATRIIASLVLVITSLHRFRVCISFRYS